MLKTVVTLLRGSASAAAEELADRNALLLLDQQMRDAQTSLATAQRALAVAVAEDALESRRGIALTARIAALETSARAAMAGGREDLGTEAAETIANLERECQAGTRAHALFEAEIVRLRRSVSDTARRLADLQRGRRVARVAEAVRVSRRGRIELAEPSQCTLSEAEATLARLRERQERAAGAEAYFETALPEIGPQTTEERLAEAGFGPAMHPTAASVLARLKQA